MAGSFSEHPSSSESLFSIYKSAVSSKFYPNSSASPLIRERLSLWPASRSPEISVSSLSNSSQQQNISGHHSKFQDSLHIREEHVWSDIRKDQEVASTSRGDS